MRVALRKPRPIQPRRRRRARGATPVARPVRAAKTREPARKPVAIGARDLRARRGGGPEDQAFYSCPCGYAFEARVSTSVHCPHCGDGQAW